MPRFQQLGLEVSQGDGATVRVMFILLAIVWVLVVRIWYDRAIAAAGINMAPEQFAKEVARLKLRSQYLLLAVILPSILGALVTKWQAVDQGAKGC